MVLEIFLMMVGKMGVLVEVLMAVMEVEVLMMEVVVEMQGGNKLKLSSSSFGSGLFFDFSNLFLMAKSTPGGLVAFFYKFTSNVFFSDI